jgi:hypothetical protein
MLLILFAVLAGVTVAAAAASTIDEWRDRRDGTWHWVDVKGDL